MPETPSGARADYDPPVYRCLACGAVMKDLGFCKMVCLICGYRKSCHD